MIKKTINKNQNCERGQFSSKLNAPPHSFALAVFFKHRGQHAPKCFAPRPKQKLKSLKKGVSISRNVSQFFNRK